MGKPLHPWVYIGDPQGFALGEIRQWALADPAGAKVLEPHTLVLALKPGELEAYSGPSASQHGRQSLEDTAPLSVGPIGPVVARITY